MATRASIRRPFRRAFLLGAALALGSSPSQGATVGMGTVWFDDVALSGQTSGPTTGFWAPSGNASATGFTFTPGSSAFTNDATSYASAQIYLQSLVLATATSGSGSDAAYLTVIDTTSNLVVGSSTNSVTSANGTVLTQTPYRFDSLALDAGKRYAFVFTSTAGVAGTSVNAIPSDGGVYAAAADIDTGAGTLTSVSHRVGGFTTAQSSDLISGTGILGPSGGPYDKQELWFSGAFTTTSQALVTQNITADTTQGSALTSTTGYRKIGTAKWTIDSTKAHAVQGDIIVEQGTLSLATAAGGNTTALIGTGQVYLLNGTPTATGVTQNSTTMSGAGFEITTTAGNATLGNAIEGAGIFRKFGGNTLTVATDSSYTGRTQIDAGTLSVSNIQDMGVVSHLGRGNSATGSILILGGTLRYTGDGTAGQGGSTNRIIGIGANANNTLDASGSGAMVFSGTTSIGFNGVTGARTLNLVGSSTAANSFGNLLANFDATNLTSLAKSGAGTWIVANASNSFSGGTTISGGTLAFASGALGTAGNITVNGGALRWHGTNTQDLSARLVFQNSGAATLDTNGNNVSFATGIGSSTSSSLTKAGAGGLTLAAAATYTGATIVSGGTLTLGVSNALADAAAVTVTGGTLALGANSDTVGALSLTAADAAASVTASSGALTPTGTITASNVANLVTVSAALGGSAALTKSGAGTLLLSGASTGWSGTSALNAGTTQVGSDSALGTGAVTLGGGALSSDGASTRTLANNLVLSADTTLGDATNSGQLILNGSADLGNSASRIVTTASAVTMGGALSNGSLTKSGNGALILSGTNTYTGKTTVTQGTLQFAKVASLYNGDVSQASWVVGNVRVASGATVAFNVGGAGEFTAANIDTLKALGNGTDGFLSGSLIGFDTTNAGGSFSYGTAIADTAGGALGLRKLGTGTLTLTAASSYTGGTFISAGTLASAVSLGSGAIDIGASGTFDPTRSGTGNALSNNLTGTGNLVLSGTGELGLTGSNSFSGTITVSTTGSGKLAFAGANSTTGAPTLVVQSGATVSLGDGFANSGAATVSNLSGAGTINAAWGSSNNTTRTLSVNSTQDTTFSGVLADAGSGPRLLALTKIGANKLTLSGTSTFTGGTTVSAGTLELAHATNTLANTGAVAISGGTLLVTNPDTVGAVTLSSGTISGTGGLTATSFGFSNASTVTVAGNLVGSGTLTKSGAGTLVLSGVNTYTGGTVITGGTLKLGADKAAGGTQANGRGSTITVRDGTFDLAGFTNYYNTTQNNASLVVWLSSGTLTLGGQAGGAPQVIDTGASQYGIGLSNSAAVTYDATNNPGTATFSAKWAQVGSSNVTTRTVNVGDSSATSLELDFTGGLGNAASIDGFRTTVRKTGAGTMRISSANAFPAVQVSAGKLIVNHANALGADTTSRNGGFTGIANLVTVDGGTLDLNGFSNSIGGLSGNNVATGVILNDGATASTLTVGSSGTATTYGGKIQDGISAVALTKVGAGKLTLSGDNAFSGNTTVSAGTLEFTGTLGAAGTYAGTITNNATLSFASASSQTLSGIVSGSGSLAKSGNGKLTLGGANTYTGNTTVSQGTLEITGTLGSSGTYAGDIANAGSLIFNSESAQTLSGILSGAGALIKNGGGTLTINGNNTYGGGTTLNAGTLVIGSNTALGTGAGSTVDVLGGTLDLAGRTLANTINVNGGRLIGATSFSGTVNATSDLTLDTDNSGFSGVVAVATGNTLTLGSNTALGDTSSGRATVNAGAALDLNGATVAAAALTLSGTGVNNTGALVNNAGTAATHSGAITLAGNTALGGSGAIVLGGAITGGANALTKTGTGTLTLNAANSYSGGTTVSGGTLVVGNTAALGSGEVLVSAGTLDLNGRAVSTPGLTLSGTGVGGAGALVNNSGTAASLSGGVALSSNSRVGGTGAITLSGAITGGSNSLTKVGSGTVDLSGTNTYTGVTAVDAGKLLVNGSVAGSVTVASGAILGGSGTIAGDLNVTGAHNPGNSPGVQTISGSVTYNTGSSVGWELIGNTTVQTSPTATYDQIVIGSNLTFAGTTNLTLSFNGAGSGVDWTNPFWLSYHSWTLFDLSSGSINGAANLNLVGATLYQGVRINGNYVDSSGTRTLNSVYATGGFYLEQVGNDIRLNYSPIPEPSTYGLALGALALAAAAIRRRRKQDSK